MSRSETTAPDAIRVRLADALRSLADPIEVQSTASRILGQHLGANRALYFEVRASDFCVERDYVDDALPLAGRYPVTSFGRDFEEYSQGRSVVRRDVARDPRLSEVERAAYAAIQIGAAVGVPLIKDGVFVAGLSVHTRGPRDWTAAEVALIEDTAERTWAAVERARSEQALRESERKYRTLFESIDEGFCLCEMLVDEAGRPLDYRFLEVNPLFEQQTGLRNPTGRTALELVPGLEPRWIEIYGKVVATGEPARFEQGSDAMGRWFNVHAYRTGAPQDRQFAILFQDITERRHAEATLRLAAERSRFVVDLSADLGGVTEPGIIEQTAVERLARVLDASRCYFAHVHDGARAVVSHEFRRPDLTTSVIGEHPIASIDRTARFLNGELVVNDDVMTDPATAASADNFLRYQIRAFISLPIFFGGEWAGILIASSDSPRNWREDERELVRDVAARIWPLLERARAVAALRDSKSRFDIVKDGAQVGFWFCDLPFDKLIWDNRVKEHFWVPPDADVTIDTFYRQLHPDDRERTRLAIEASIAERTQYDIEYRTVSEDGREKWIRAIGRTFYDAQFAPIRFDGVTLDITDRKRAEAALVDADRRKDEFLAMLAHELRNPLAPIRHAAEVLKMTQGGNPEQRWARDVIERQTQHITRLVDDLLDVSRISRGKIALRSERVAVAAVIDRAVEAIRPLIDARGQALSVSLPESALEVEGDATRLVQVLSNLLSNASKFSHDGGPIAVSAAREGGHAVIRVADQGIGIPRELMPRVFDLFTQADRSLDRSQGGLGIGLTLARLLVDRHGGTIEARSDGAERGSEFEVRLPIAEGVATPAPIAVPHHAPSRRPLRVLVVEDNEDSAEMLSTMMRLQGYETEVARDGMAALEAARRFQPRAILCDIGLPGMNGYQVTQQLRAQPWAAPPRLIALSGYGQDEDRRRASAAGFEHHLVKPVEPHTLFALLDSLSD